MSKLQIFRLSILAGTCAILAGAWVVRAHAEEGAPSMCRPLAEMKATMTAHNIQWTTLSSDQWQFARAVFVTNPQTPPGMPFGDSAGLIQKIGDEKSGGVIVFVDGDQGCEPMPIPAELVEMMMHLGTITHQGDGM